MSRSINAANVKIEKGVEIPELVSWRHLAQEMKMGDSIGGLTQNQAHAIASHLRSFGFNAARRIDPKMRGAFRIWKLEKR